MKTIKWPPTPVGTKIKCISCQEEFPLESTKDILCSYNQEILGVCKTCWPAIQEKLAEGITVSLRAKLCQPDNPMEQ